MNQITAKTLYLLSFREFHLLDQQKLPTLPIERAELKVKVGILPSILIYLVKEQPHINMDF